MTSDSNSLATLIGSRICHDLISPIGAVNNGLELLSLSGATPSPELSLVAESLANANARIRFFRLAFGVASDSQMIGADEVNAILRDVYTDGRIAVAPFPAGSFSRAEVRAVMLALLCAEQAIPYGGTLGISLDRHGWTVAAEGHKLNPQPDHWAALSGQEGPAPAQPSAVQFLLLPQLLAELGLICRTDVSDRAAEIRLIRE